MSNLSTHHVIRTYRRYAPVYDVLFGHVLEPGRRKLCEEIRSLSPASLLEVGVGTGLTLLRYPKTSRIVGIDISDDMLALARRKTQNLPGMNVSLFVMNGEKMGFPDHAFDCVAVPYVLSVTPNPAQLVAELRRVCKPDGTIFILNHFSGSRFWHALEQAVSSVADKIGFRSSFHFDQHILSHDWQVESVTPVNLMGLSKLVRIRNNLPGLESQK